MKKWKKYAIIGFFVFLTLFYYWDYYHDDYRIVQKDGQQYIQLRWNFFYPTPKQTYAPQFGFDSLAEMKQTISKGDFTEKGFKRLASWAYGQSRPAALIPIIDLNNLYEPVSSSSISNLHVTWGIDEYSFSGKTESYHFQTYVLDQAAYEEALDILANFESYLKEKHNSGREYPNRKENSVKKIYFHSDGLHPCKKVIYPITGYDGTYMIIESYKGNKDTDLLHSLFPNEVYILGVSNDQPFYVYLSLGEDFHKLPFSKWLAQFGLKEFDDSASAPNNNSYEPQYPASFSDYQVIAGGNDCILDATDESGIRCRTRLVSPEYYDKELNRLDHFVSYLTENDYVLEENSAQMPDRGTTYYYRLGERTHRHMAIKTHIYQVTHNGNTYTVEETNIGSGSKDVPSYISIYGCSGGQPFEIFLRNFSDRPSVEWLSQFGIKRI